MLKTNIKKMEAVITGDTRSVAFRVLMKTAGGTSADVRAHVFLSSAFWS